jgi:protein O-mannosyl-transferase
VFPASTWTDSGRFASRLHGLFPLGRLAAAPNFSVPRASLLLKRMKCRFLGLILVLAAVGAYWTSFPGTFVYDDYPLLLQEPRVTGDRFDYGAFVDHYGGRPLTLYSFHLNHRWAGGSSPLSYHAVSVGLHIVVALMVFLAIRSWTEGLFVPFAAALLFAVHPAQTQAVNYVWSRSMLLMAFFGGLALLTARRGPWVSLGAYQLAIWSRSEALVFLAPLLVLNRRLKVPGTVIACVNLAGLAYGLLRHAPADLAWTHSSWLDYWARALTSFWLYVRMMVWPSEFSIYHAPPGAGWSTALPAAFAVIGFLMLVLLLLRRGHRPVALGLGWVGVFLVPSLMVPNSDVFNESRIYMALAGFVFLAALTLERVGGWLDSLARAAKQGFGGGGGAWALVGVLAIGYLSVTIGRHETWRDEAALWREAVGRAGGMATPHYNLAVALSRRGEIAGARKSFETAVLLNPEDDMSYAGLGFCAESEGRWLDARGLYDRAVSLNPDNEYAREAALRIQARLAMGAADP